MCVAEVVGRSVTGHSQTLCTLCPTDFCQQYSRWACFLIFNVFRLWNSTILGVCLFFVSVFVHHNHQVVALSRCLGCVWAFLPPKYHRTSCGKSHCPWYGCCRCHSSRPNTHLLHPMRVWSAVSAQPVIAPLRMNKCRSRSATSSNGTGCCDAGLPTPEQARRTSSRQSRSSAGSQGSCSRQGGDVASASSSVSVQHADNTSISSRTGGFERPMHVAYFPRSRTADDDTSLPSSSIYTAGTRHHTSHKTASVTGSVQDATTISSSNNTNCAVDMATPQTRHTLCTDLYRDCTVSLTCPSEASTVRVTNTPLNGDDIKPQLDGYRRNVRKSWARNNPRNGLATTTITTTPATPLTPVMEDTDGQENQPNRCRTPSYQGGGMSWNKNNGRLTTESKVLSVSSQQKTRGSGSTGTLNGNSLTPPHTTQPSSTESYRTLLPQPQTQQLRTTTTPRRTIIQGNDKTHIGTQQPPSPAKTISKPPSLSVTYRASTDSAIEVIAATADDSITISSQFPHEVNMGDKYLMTRSSSPGALRLTEEGLKEHEEKVFFETAREKPKSSFEAWSKSRNKQRWYRAKHQERDVKLEEDAMRIRRRKEHWTTNSDDSTRNPFVDDMSIAASPRVSPKPISTLIPSRKKIVKQEVTDLSLAPLSSLDHVTSKCFNHAAQNGDKKSPNRLFGLFRRSKVTSEKLLKERLERERQAALEAERKQQILEMQERERIERRRQEYLEMQRARETAAVMQRSASNFFSGVDIVRTESHDMSTMSSTRSNLPPCVVCGENERTHIATPCMHFSFCHSCVTKIMMKPTLICPLCKTKDVSFAIVSV